MMNNKKMTTKELIVNKHKSIDYEVELDEGPISGMTVLYRMFWELEPAGRAVRVFVSENDIRVEEVDGHNATYTDYHSHRWLIELWELEYERSYKRT